MKLYDLLDPFELDDCISEGMVTSRASGDGQTIFNYTDKAQREGVWNATTTQCRGLIVDDDSEQIVARPWAKFFNHNEAHAKLTEADYDSLVEVTDKLDGSLGILHRAPDGTPRVATRGSFHSEQAEWATKWVRERYPSVGWDFRMTPLVEIIYPENRIVCDYKGFAGLRLLGYVSIEHGTYFGPERHPSWISGAAHGLYPTHTFPAKTLREALKIPPRKGAEGVCVRLIGQNKIVKVKQADYIELHRIVMGLNERAIWQHLVDGGTLDELLDGIPDELHAWVRGVCDDLWRQAWVIWHKAEYLFDLIEQELGGCSDGLGLTYTRAEFAEKAKQHGELAKWLFMRLDEKPYWDAILKTLKPQGTKYESGESTTRHEKYGKAAA